MLRRSEDVLSAGSFVRIRYCAIITGFAPITLVEEDFYRLNLPECRLGFYHGIKSEEQRGLAAPQDTRHENVICLAGKSPWHVFEAPHVRKLLIHLANIYI